MAGPEVSNPGTDQLARELYEAVERNNPSTVESLLRLGANPNHHLYWSEEWKNKYLYPPLHEACSNGFLDIVKLLVSNGAHTEKSGGKWNKTPLHLACCWSHKEVVMYLLQDVGCSADVRDGGGCSPFDLALGNCEPDIAYFLLSHGHGHYGDEDKVKLVTDVCWLGKLDVAKKLFEHHNIDSIPGFNSTVVLDRTLDYLQDNHMDGICNGDTVDCALYLISRGYGSDEQKAKLLCEACYHGNLNTVKELVEHHEVKPEAAKDLDGRSPLQNALYPFDDWYDEDDDMKEIRTDIAYYLIEHGCDCDDEDKTELLCRAYKWGKLDIVKELVEKLFEEKGISDNGNGKRLFEDNDSQPPPAKKQKGSYTHQLVCSIEKTRAPGRACKHLTQKKLSSPPQEGKMEEKFNEFIDTTFPEGSKRTRSALIRRSFADQIVKCLKSPAEEDNRNFRHFVKKSEFQLMDEAGLRDCLVVKAGEKKKNKNDPTIMKGFRRVAIVEDFYTILQQVHDKDCGHAGCKKTFARIQSLYAYLPRSVVETYIKLCPTCSQRRPQTTKPPLHPIISTSFFSRVQINLIDMQHTPDNDHKWILHVVDQWSKFQFAVPLQNKSASDVTQALQQYVFPIIGLPNIIQSDNGREFVDKLIKEVLAKWPGQEEILSEDPPQTQGQAKQTTLEQMIAAKIDEAGVKSKSSPWTEWLPLIVYTINTQVHEATNQTPYELVFGQLPRSKFQGDLEKDVQANPNNN